jgi:hypothetical protein
LCWNTRRSGPRAPHLHQQPETSIHDLRVHFNEMANDRTFTPRHWGLLRLCSMVRRQARGDFWQGTRILLDSVLACSFTTSTLDTFLDVRRLARRRIVYATCVPYRRKIAMSVYCTIQRHRNANFQGFKRGRSFHLRGSAIELPGPCQLPMQSMTGLSWESPVLNSHVVLVALAGTRLPCFF